MKRRVVITGAGFVSPAGVTCQEIFAFLSVGKSAVRRRPELSKVFGVQSDLCAPVEDFDEKDFPRQWRRSMSRISLMAAAATQSALARAGWDEKLTQSSRTGLSFGSTMGGTSAIEKAFRALFETQAFEGFLSTTFLQIMSHTAAANLATAFGIQGRMLASCTACASSLQSIGFAYENIKYGLSDAFICGGAEELHGVMVGVFDTMKATSMQFLNCFSSTPRPFDTTRDGLVVGEGAGTLLLEERESALRRGAPILAEVLGFSTGSDGGHMTNPSREAMARVMQEALLDAQLSPHQVDYVNAHATATPVGDVAESHAIYQIFGGETPVSSLKGSLGHLMGASGVIELGACLGMLENEMAMHTQNLRETDPACAALDYVKSEPRPMKLNTVLKNSFGFGGVNASIIIRKAIS
jgi:3-oxoacyl-[acyl-carrier-protein] synthase II